MRPFLTTMLCLWSCVAGAALDYTKNTNNFTKWSANTIGAQLNGSSAISFSCLVNFDSLDPAGNDLIAVRNSANVAFLVFINTNKVRVQARRVTGDGVAQRDSNSSLSTGTSYHIGVIARFDGTAPDVYLNGVLDNGTASGTLTSGTMTTTSGSNHDSVGCLLTGATPTGTTRQVDGYMAEVGLWVRSIGADGMAAMGRGFQPPKIGAHSMVLYIPGAANANELRSSLTPSTTGSVPQRAHPVVR